MAKGILIATMNIGGAAEDEFHDWYDTEHLPERQRVPGFLLCQRWIGAQDPKIVVLDVAPVASQVNRNAARACKVRKHRSRDDARLERPPRLSDRCYVVDVDVKANHYCFCRTRFELCL